MRRCQGRRRGPPALAASTLIFAIPLGIFAAWKAGSLTDRALMVFAVGGLSVPIFWPGFLLIFVVLRCLFHIFVLRRRPDLHGGGLVRSLGGWAAIHAIRRGRAAARPS